MWFKVDDKMHAHRKTRRGLRSHGTKRLDVAPFGLWVLAGSWVGDNDDAGWIPEFELERFDDDWAPLAERLVDAGYWWPEKREGEAGFGFVNYEEYNPAHGASASGTFGNHVRWHANRGVVEAECEHCPKEPESLPDAPEPSGRIAPRSGPESVTTSPPESESIAIPEPEPVPEPETLLRIADAKRTPDASHPDADDRFDEWWDLYGKKVDRKKAQAKWKAALKKKGVTVELLMESTARYIRYQKESNGHPKFTKDPTTWLNGECWNNELPALALRADDDTAWKPEPVKPRHLFASDDDYRHYLERRGA